MGDAPAIAATGLAKSYGETRVVDGVDLQVERGNVFALLGPNGAGKTTVVRMLATVASLDAGRATVAGYDVVTQRREVRSRISLTGQYAALDERQTGRENLHMMGRLRRLSAAQASVTADELLARFDLTDAGGRRVGTYSGGMRRRLDLAAGLVGRPEILFLDEPTTGLDPRSRQGMWDVVTGLARDGVTVFLTTQYLDEADQLADRIAVIDAGRLVAEGSAAQLKARVAQLRLDLQLRDTWAYDAVAELLGSRSVHADRGSRTLGVATDGSAVQIRRLLDEVDPQARWVERFALHTASLDDVFFALTGARTAPADADEEESVAGHV